MEEIRLELEDKILNGLLTFDLASRQISPTRMAGETVNRGHSAGRGESANETRSGTPMTLGDEVVDSGTESDLAPQVDDLLKRLRAPPKATADEDGDVDVEPLSDDWPSSNEDNDEGIADSADEIEAQDDIDPAEDNVVKAPVEAESLQKADTDDLVTMDEPDPVELCVGARRYDLGKMAETGHGGKIMFVFQKISNGKLKTDT